MPRINSSWPWPHDVAVRGTFAEEVKALEKLERDPEAAPMPASLPTRMLSPARSSDHLRLAVPNEARDPDEPDFLVPPYVVFRRVLSKRRRSSWSVFEEAVEGEDFGADVPEHRREQMRAMLGRERAMLEILSRYNNLAEDVYMRLLGESKG
ncbi:MAG: hypothetical protein H6729_09350 [Deltaproteobacteria bacterium]|nr:hypothetical protein [Deltaproteobacteria bacterium]